MKRAPFIDPFEKMQFPEHAHAKGPGRIPRGLDEFTICISETSYNVMEL